MQITLKTEWATAMPMRVADSSSSAGARAAWMIIKSTRQRTVPMILKQRCTRAARRAFLLVPTEDSMAVMQVPMFWPMMMGMAVPMVTWPVADRACRIPTEAEELWMMAVRTAPASTPRMGLEKISSIWPKAGTSLSPATASDMASIPNISTAKPSRIIPVSLFLELPLLSLRNIIRIMPTRARIGVKELGFSSRTNKLLLSMPPRDRIHAVIVVPMLAPMITWIAWRRVIRPELTKPTTITVEAEELWMTAVTPMPVNRPATLPVVSLASRVRRLLPARRSRDSPMSCMPKRNKQSPPMRDNTSKISIFSHFLLYLQDGIFYTLFTDIIIKGESQIIFHSIVNSV